MKGKGRRKKTCLIKKEVRAVSYVPIFGGFRLAWVKYACERMLLTTVAEKSWLALGNVYFIFECVCIAGGGGAPQLPFSSPSW